MFRPPTFPLFPYTTLFRSGAGTELALGATFDANGPGLAAALTAAGAEVVRVGSVPDDADALVEQLRAGITADDAELIVTSGGVSAGAFERSEEHTSERQSRG